MERSIVDVARMAGVTARTLRHYHDIGLLIPSSIGVDGYRRYDDAALLRLQHILVLRALGLPLPEIREALDLDRDEVEILTAHRDRLRAEGDRLHRMAATVLRTLEQHLAQEGTGQMTVSRPENLFEGFDQEQYAAEARERWPEQAASSEAYAATLTPAQVAEQQQAMTAHIVRVAAARAAGDGPESPAVQAEMAWLHAAVSRLWVPDAAAFTNLGRMYVEDERFRATYERVAPRLAEFVRDAMAVYAETVLA